MADLHPEHAKAAARTALAFVASFNGEDFGHAREMQPGPHDGRHLAIALDQLEELAAMVLNLAGRCIAAPPATAPVRLTDEQRFDLVSNWIKSPQRILEEFASQVEAAVLRANGFSPDHPERNLELVGQAIRAAVAAERQAIIESIPGGDIVDPQLVCDMIRQRGEDQSTGAVGRK